MRPEQILFDLSRVLADLGSPSTRMRLEMSDEEFCAIWLLPPIVQSFERGDIGPCKFLLGMASELDCQDDLKKFRQRFLDWHPRCIRLPNL